MNICTVSRTALIVAVAITAVFPVADVATAAPGVGQAVREAVEFAFKKSGREAVERVSREAVEKSVEAGVAKYGPRAAQAVADGGVELVEAASKYGDDVMRVAVEASPAARRTLALQPSQMLPLVREFGGEAIEVEAKSPGLARRVFAAFGDDGGRQVARQVPAEDLPRLVAYAEKADTPETRRILLEVYKKEGPITFDRIPATLVLATGLSASMLYGTHRITTPFVAAGDAIRQDPNIGSNWTNGLLIILGAVALLATIFVLASFRLTPWHATSQRAAVPGPAATAAACRNTDRPISA